MQMKEIKYFIYGLGLLFASAFAACSDSEEDIPVPPVEKETCSLTIQLGAEGAAETRVGGDQNAKTGEFINTLWVFVTNTEGVIEAKFNLNDGSSTYISEATDKNTPNGNISQWMHTVENIPTGEKYIYAFANMDNVSETTNSTNMKTLLDDFDANENLSVDNLIISDPAGNVDITHGEYIPMSLKEKVTITGDQTIYVELVRLVSRVDVTIRKSKAEDVALQTLSMENFADQVSLIQGSTVTIPTPYSTSVSVDLSGKSIITENPEATTYFYVNETNSDDYTVTLTTGTEADAETYTGLLSLTDPNTTGIPRNHYLPLILNIGDSKFVVEIYVAPIGGYPRNVLADGDLLDPSTTSTVEVPEGCSFRVRDSEDATKYYPLSTNSTSSVAIGTDNTWAHITALETTGASVIADGTTIPLTIIPLADYALTGSLGWEMIPQGVLMMK